MRFLRQAGNELADFFCSLFQCAAVLFFFGIKIVDFALKVFFEFADLHEQRFAQFVNGGFVFALLLFMLELEAVDFFIKAAVFTNKGFKFFGPAGKR